MLFPKIVGIDLDNTIINYNNAFSYAAIKFNLLTEDWLKSNLLLGNGISTKNLIKIAILNKEDGQKNWEFLQGQVYGNFIQYAEIFPGVANFLFHCFNRGIKVFIVSHKTEFGHHDKSATPLRKAAIKFLKEKKILNIDYSPSEKDVFYFDTRQKKVNKIDVLNCNYFIDDFLALKTATSEDNRTGIDKLISNNFTQLNDYEISNIQNSFLELYSDKDTHFDAIHLMHYLLVKDGFNINNRGTFLSLIPLEFFLPKIIAIVSGVIFGPH